MRTILTLPEQLRRSLTWDQGAELAQHARLKIDAGPGGDTAPSRISPLSRLAPLGLALCGPFGEPPSLGRSRPKSSSAVRGPHCHAARRSRQSFAYKRRFAVQHCADWLTRVDRLCSTALAASALGFGWSNCRPAQQLASLPDFDEVKPWQVPPSLACSLDGGPNIRRTNVRSADNTIIGRWRSPILARSARRTQGSFNICYDGAKPDRTHQAESGMQLATINCSV
jgi:hypothetical protein